MPETLPNMVLLDTNILIYHLNGALTPEVRGKIHAWVEDGAAISVISRIEVLGFRQAEEDMAAAERLLGVFVEVPLSEEVVRGTILLRQERRISVPDAIIAASALRMGASLITRNVRDFAGIDGLVVIDPFAA